jgi:tetratricopeptide (TPR) repeat protein
MSAFLERGRLLVSQGRWDLAEKELRMAVGESPDSAAAHGLLAIVLSRLKRDEEALGEAQAAVRLGPERPMSHYFLADVLDRMDRLKEAEASIRTAIQLNPEDADYHASLAGILFQQSRWAETLAAAEEGLKQDPDHVNCLNFRGLALMKLGRREQAGANMAETLARGPENALSHTVQGWNYLESNRPRDAAECFRTALRLSPGLDYAKRGMVEALKARNPIYRVMLLYFLWMARLSGRARWAVVVGFFIGYQVLKAAADSNPALRPFVLPIIVCYLIFVVLTWVAQPMFNLLLGLNRFGRYALSDHQIVASNWFGGFLAVAVVLSLAGWLSNFGPALLLGIWCGFMLAPVAMAMQASKPKKRRLLCAAAGGLGVLGLFTIVLVFTNQPASETPLGLFVIGWALFPWLVNIVG